MLHTPPPEASDPFTTHPRQWRNLWLCTDGTTFWGDLMDTEAECLDDIKEWMDGAREIEARDDRGFITCVFYGDVVPENVPMERRTILNYTVIPIPVI